MKETHSGTRTNRGSVTGRLDRWAVPLLITVSILIRIPFLKNFDLVAFDGTYYIRQALSLFHDYAPYGGYPVGYPFFIAIFIPVIRDAVRAAQVVSFLFTMGSTLMLYALAKRYLTRRHAFLCALVFAITPLAIRYSLLTMSEAGFVFWLLLGLYLYSRKRFLFSGMAVGLATITRPEGIATMFVLGLLKIRRPKQAAMLAAGWLILFSINTAVYYTGTGHLKILPKRHLIARAWDDWRAEEFKVEREPGEDAGSATGADSAETEGGNSVIRYLSRLFAESDQLLRHLLPVALLLAIYGITRHPVFLVAPLLQFFLYPFFNIRIAPRYILPYIPVLLFFCFLGIEALRHLRLRRVALALVLASALAGLVINSSQYLEPASQGQVELKEAGLDLRDVIKPGQTIADRKPFLAFYANGDYVKIPDNTYNTTIDYLLEHRVDYLTVHESTILLLRPALSPLLYDPFMINGELRFQQVYSLMKETNHSVLVYKRARDSSPLMWKQLTSSAGGEDSSPAWSPDGRSVAFSSSRTGNGDIYIIPAAGGNARLVTGGNAVEDLPAWSPDGRKIAFISNRSGNFDIFTVDLETGSVQPVTSNPATDSSPSWRRDGRSIFFFSDRTGRPEIWEKALDTGELTQITSDAENRFLSVSPQGTSIAWVQDRRRVVIRDLQSGESRVPVGPANLYFAPTWSPDERFIAVTSAEWGSSDLYLLRADGGHALLLTKLDSREGQPAWSPAGDTIALVSTQSGQSRIWLLSGLAPYMDRLMNPVEFMFLRRGVLE